jgi:response regulator RpfG family c-di-GMP phosphodiesterase
MTPAVTVLMACDDPFATRGLSEEVRQIPEMDLTVTIDGAGVFDLALELMPDLIICGATVGESDGLEICRAVKADGRIAHAHLVYLTAHGDREAKADALQAGVDAFLTVPLDPEDVRAMLKQAARLGSQREQILQGDGRLKTAGRDTDQVVRLLVNLIEARLPGAADRGDTLASLAGKVAERFKIPAHLLPDLDIAARLQEIGKIVDPATAAHVALEHRPARSGPSYAVVSGAVLKKLDLLSGAAEVVGAMGENWDGTGLPDRIRKGQIPLRSRILRVLVDFLDELPNPETPSASEVLSQLKGHGGTLYDPLVIVHLRSVVGDREGSAGVGENTQLTVAELREGMVLAEDIFTSSGVMLLARGAVLTEATLEVIKYRNQVDPVVSGVSVCS